MQFRLVDLFVLVALCAVLFGLVYWVGALLGVMIGVVPICLISERILARPNDDRDIDWQAPNTGRVKSAVVCALGTPIAAQISVSTGVPRVPSPLPLLSILPLFLELYYVGSVVMIGVFLLYSWPITRSPRGAIPVRATVLLLLASVLTVAWFVNTWSGGEFYQGVQFTLAMTSINALAMFALWLIWAYNHRHGTFAGRMTFLTMLFYWLFWFAFPWLGELI